MHGLFAAAIVFLTSYAILGATQDWDRNCSPSSISGQLVRYNNNSKFLVGTNGERMTLAQNSHNKLKAYCESLNLEIPSSTHLADWLTIQKMLREDRPIVNGLYVYRTGDYEPVQHQGWKTTDNQSTPYILWRNDRLIDPVDSHHFYVVLTTRELGDTWYLRASDWNNYEPVQDTEPNIRYCQYPRHTRCYKDSFEEIEYRRIMESHRNRKFVYMGSSHHNHWFISLHTLYFQDAEKECNAVGSGFKIWQYDDSTYKNNGTEEVEILKRYMLAFLKKQDGNFVTSGYGHQSSGKTPALAICHKYYPMGC